MGATKDTFADLSAVTDHLTVAVLTHWSNGLNRALETVENVSRSKTNHFEGLVILVATHFTSGHLSPRELKKFPPAGGVAELTGL